MKFAYPPGAGGGGGAPTNAQYVALATDATLTDERVLTAGTGIGITDAGAGSTVTVALSHLGIQSLTDPNADRLLFWDDSAGNAEWLTLGTNLSITGTTINASGGGSGSPGGSDTEIQFNDGGSFGGDSGFTFDKTTNKLSMNNGLSWSGSVPSVIEINRTLTTPPNTPPGAVNPFVGIFGTLAQSGAINQGRIGLYVTMGDDASVVNKTITGAASNGGPNLVRITCTGHTFATGDRINVYAVGGTTEANGVWTITVIDANTFDLQSSTFSNAYTSGGTATNRGLYYAATLNVRPALDRPGNLLEGTGTNGDDVACLTMSNDGAGKATDAIWVTDASISGGSKGAWNSILASDSDVDRFISYYGTVYTVGIDLTSATAKTGSEPMIAVGDGHIIKSGTTVPSYFATKVINTDADATVSALDLGSTFTKNDTNTRAFSVARVKPTLNFGGSNTNTTVNLLHVDTTNTATTGSTVNLAKIAYGGADRFTILSTAEVTHRGSDGSSTVYTWDNHSASLTANTTINNFIARQSAGTFTTPLRTQTGQVVLRLSAAGYTAVDDSTTAVMVAAHKAALDFVAGASDWTTSDNEMYARFRTTGPGSTTAAVRAYVNEQGITIGATTANRGTTQPTNAINIFNGTAPAGTLTNGASFYAVSGEIRSKDSAGREARPNRPIGRAYAMMNGYTFP